MHAFETHMWNRLWCSFGIVDRNTNLRTGVGRMVLDSTIWQPNTDKEAASRAACELNDVRILLSASIEGFPERVPVENSGA